MAFRVEWSPRALEDVVAIGEYISNDSMAYAATVVKRIILAARKLPLFPTAGRIVPELEDTGLREEFIYNYRLIYRMEPTLILVVAVIHGNRIISESILG